MELINFDTIYPYIGILFVIFISSIIIVYLSKHGIIIKKFKNKYLEIEFENKFKKAAKKTNLLKIQKEQIVFTQDSNSDYLALKLNKEAITFYIHEEIKRHPKIFGAEFSSLPFSYCNYVLLLSWNSINVIIERVLTRNDAYPINDTWNKCLSLYRQAIILSYRNNDSNLFITSVEAKRLINFYERLLQSFKEFVDVLSYVEKSEKYEYDFLTATLLEAESAYENEEIGVLISRLELILSKIHKYLINHAPRGSLESDVIIDTIITKDIISNKPLVLIVDDEKWLVLAIGKMLADKYTIFGVTSGYEALKKIVDYSFDIVITDQIIGDKINGVEITRSVKSVSPSTKVIVISGYYTSSKAQGIEEAGADEFLMKPFTPKSILDTIENLLK